MIYFVSALVTETGGEQAAGGTLVAAADGQTWGYVDIPRGSLYAVNQDGRLTAIASINEDEIRPDLHVHGLAGVGDSAGGGMRAMVASWEPLSIVT